MATLFMESIIIGVICMSVGSVVFAIVAKLSPLQLSKKGKDNVLDDEIVSYNTALIMQVLISLFLTGFLGHLFFEITGMNTRLHRWTGVWLW